MASIRALCKTGVLLEKGMVRATGRINNVVETYLDSAEAEMYEIVKSVRVYDESIRINCIRFNGSINNKTTIVSNQEFLDVVIDGETSKCLKNTDIQILFKSREETPMAILCEGHYKGATEDIPIGKFRIEKRIILPRYLGQGDYKIDIAMHEPMVRWLFYAENAVFVHADGGLDGVGQAMNMKSGGVIGLETTKGL